MKRPKGFTLVWYLMGVFSLFAAAGMIGFLFLAYMSTLRDVFWIIVFLPFFLLLYKALRIQISLYRLIWKGIPMTSNAVKIHKIFSVMAGFVLGIVLTYLFRMVMGGYGDSLLSAESVVGIIVGIIIFIPHMNLSSKPPKKK